MAGNPFCWEGAGAGGTGGRDDWTVQETILATNDTDSGAVQGVYSLYTDLVRALVYRLSLVVVIAWDYGVLADLLPTVRPDAGAS